MDIDTYSPSLDALPLALIAPLPGEYEFRLNDRVTYHGYFNDYPATVVGIRHGTRLAPTTYRLSVEDEFGILDWVWTRAERITIVLTATAVEMG